MRALRCLFRGFLIAGAAALVAQPLSMPRVRVAGSQEAVKLEALDLRVDVVGAIATTTWEITVRNPQDRVLEGELLFPLGEGQTLSRFALDVNGRMREGVVVEKAKGRQVFEAIVRRGVDPGLLEKTEGNAFRARVYPVPARGTQRILIATEQELPFAPASEGEALRYHVPFDFKEPIPSFHLRVQVHEQDLAPRVASSPLPGLGFERWQRAFVAETRRERILLNRPFTLLLPRSPEATALFLEKAAEATYFALAVDPRLPRRAKALPQRILLLWDASASARGRNLTKENAVLDAYFRRIGRATVRLVLFRDRAEAPRDFDIQDGRWDALRQALATAPLDGATAFGKLDLASLKVDETLLLSDGLNTFGSFDPRLPEAPLVALFSAAVGDPARLRFLAERKGGECLDLTRLTEKEALEALLSQAPRFMRATYEPGSVEALHPSGGQVLRGSFVLAGKLLRPGTRLTLHFGYASGATRSRAVVLGRETGSEAPVRRLWAQKRLAELQIERERNAKAILALGKAYGLVTEGTSLIVLEEARDYATYGIDPPEELREAVLRLRAGAQASEEERRKAHLEQVLKAFQERQAWWSTVFKPISPAEQKASSARDAAASVEVVAADAPRPGPAPAPAAGNVQREERASAKKAKNGSGGGPEAEKTPRAAIEMKPWNPDTPYLKELAALPKEERYAGYLRLREMHGESPSYFLDVADFFEREGERALARRILSNLAELKLEDPALLRILGWRLEQLGELDDAAWVLAEVLRIREEEGQSRRDLALVLAKRGRAPQAAELLWQVVSTPGDGRFRDLPLIALGELNALLAAHPGRVDTSGMDPRLLENLPVDIRVVLNWDTPNSDMDLHVVDPRGETCFYGHARTALGGRISADVTQGYGPEEFLLRHAIPGRYRIQAKFFGTRQQTVVGATTVRLELFLRYATGRVENKGALLRLSGPGRMVDVGDFVFE